MSVVFRLKFEDDDAAAKVQKIETGVASATKEVDKARDALGKLAKTGASAGQTVAKSGEEAAKGLSKTSTAADKGVTSLTRLDSLIAATNAELVHTKAAADPAASAFSGLVEQIEREARIMERIRGPMREYQADMDALDRLMEKGTLTAIEYNEEIEKLIKRQGTMQGPIAPPTPAAPSGIGVGAAIGSLAAGGGLLALAHGLEDVIEKAHEVEDVFINMTNAAGKFVDSTHSVNVVMNEQISLAHDLHSGLGATLDAYDAVRDGTDELNLSHQEQIRLTKSLGEAVQISGKSLDHAGGLMSKFSYALASGKIETRELKGIMKEVPDIASLWTTSFNTTRVGLIKMVQTGKVGTEDLMRALIDDTKALDDNFAKRERTNAQKKEEWILNEKLYSQKHNVSLGRGHQAEAMDNLMNGAANQRRDFFTKLADDATHMSGQFAEAGKAARQLDKDFHEMVTNVLASVPQLTKGLADIVGGFAIDLGLASDPWSGKTEPAFIAELKMLQKINGPVGEAKEQMTTLQALQSKGVLTTEQYRKNYNELMTTMNDGRLPETIRLWEAIREPQLAFNRGVRALDSLLAGNLITLQQYNAELKKLSDTRFGPEMTRLFDLAARPVNANSQAGDYAKHQADVAHEGVIGDKTAAIEKQYRTPDGPDLSADLAAFDKRAAADAARPESVYRSQVSSSSALFERGKISAAEYEKAVDSARLALLAATEEGKTFAGSMEQSWLRMKAGAGDVGREIADSLIGDLDKLNDALIQAANGGEVAWGKMADSMIQDLERILIKQLEVLAITAILNAIAPGAGSAATSSGVTGQVVNQLPNIPGYATGGQWVVGGSGGTDSQLAQFRVTPGETVTVQTPEQRRAEAGGSSSGSESQLAPVIHVHNHMSESVVVGALTSRAGETAIVNVMRKVNSGMRG
jgi:tape measure domain-containing protein